MLPSKATWKIIDDPSEGIDTLTIEDILQKLFRQKGIETAEEQARFLHPSLAFIQTAANFAAIERAKRRVEQAIQTAEKILVYGDYDADGVTATTVLVEGLRRLGAQCEFFVPNRFREGYGLNEAIIEEFAAEGFTLIITVDTGIANTKEVEKANELGIDVIITDHHEPQTELPPAYAIIHPALSENYSFKSLAGVGVAFQFVRYLLDEMPEDLLDLVAIGTIADLVPLIGENRIFAYFGLQRLKQTKRIGLRQLFTACGLEDEVTTWDVAFRIAPRINAVGRLEDANTVVDLLLTNDAKKAEEIVTYIEVLNDERKKYVDTIVEEASSQIDTNDLFIMLANEAWHEGVLGIAAAKLVKMYHRPVLLLTEGMDRNTWKGSARSIPSYNIFSNGIQIRELFTSFGGHAQAAGVTFPKENFAQIKEHFLQTCQEQLTEADLTPQLTISQKLHINQLTEQLVTAVKQFAPFGYGNEEPLFLLEAIPTQIRQIGQQQAHLKLQFTAGDKIVEAIGFNFGNIAPLLSGRAPVSFVGRLDVNEWNGKRTVQIIIEDIAVKEWQLFDYRGKKDLINLASFILEDQNHVLLTNDKSTLQADTSLANVHIASYEDEPALLPKAHILFIYDLPTSIDSLIEVLKYTRPNAIHVAYHLDESVYLKALPEREHFKWFYGYIKKYQPLSLKTEIPRIIQLTKWSKEAIIFMVKVFQDLQFIHVDEDVISVNEYAKKADLSASRTYQQFLERSKIEQLLYYSTYEELKEWLMQYSLSTNEEENIHGLKTIY